MRDYRTYLIKSAAKWGRRAVDIMKQKGLKGRDLLPLPKRIEKEKEIYKRLKGSPEPFLKDLAKMPNLSGFVGEHWGTKRPRGPDEFSWDEKFHSRKELPTGLKAIYASAGNLKPNRAAFEKTVRSRIDSNPFNSFTIPRILEQLKLQAGLMSFGKKEQKQVRKRLASPTIWNAPTNAIPGAGPLLNVPEFLQLPGLVPPQTFDLRAGGKKRLKALNDQTSLLTLQSFFPDSFKNLREIVGNRLSASSLPTTTQDLYALNPVAKQVQHLIQSNPKGLLKYLEKKRRGLPATKVKPSREDVLPPWLHGSEREGFPVFNPEDFMKAKRKGIPEVSKKYKQHQPEYDPESYAWRGFNIKDEPMENVFVSGYPAIAGGYATRNLGEQVLGRIPLKNVEHKLKWTPHIAKVEEEKRQKLEDKIRRGKRTLYTVAGKRRKGVMTRNAGQSSWGDLGHYEAILPKFDPVQADKLFTLKTILRENQKSRQPIMFAQPLQIKQKGQLIPATIENMRKHPAAQSINAYQENYPNQWNW